METFAEAQSKFVLSGLALRSIIELERLNAGMDFDQSVLESLSTALRKVTRLDDSTLQLGFIEPDYFGSMDRLYRVSVAGDGGDVEKIQEYTRSISEQLNSPLEAGSDVAKGLLSVCATLHSELVQDLSLDDDTRTHGRPSIESFATASLCAA